MSGSSSFTAPSVEDLQPHFSQYVIEKLVAMGGMGAVYRATQSSVDRPVALKILPPDLAGDEQFRARFEMEAKAMAKLSHRNLVQIYDFGETNGVVWMIQEWVDGRTIYELMQEEELLPPKEAAALVAQACEGLDYAHRQGIIHRDVKPANMMVDGDGILKLMDFGLARSTKSGEGPRTQGGARFATEEYAAPELWDLSAQIDHRVDIFALGVLLYEMLTGQRPTGTFKLPSEWRSGLDPRYDEIVVRAMQGDPNGRYASCGEMLTALRAVVTSAPKVMLKTSAKPASGPLLQTPSHAESQASGAGPVFASAHPAAPTPKKKKNPTVLVGILSVLLLLGALAGGWFYLTKDSGKGKESADEGAPGAEGGRTPEAGGTPPAKPPKSRPPRSERPVAANPPEETPKPAPTRPSEPTPPKPKPKPEPEPAPAPATSGADQVLADLDAGMRANVAASLKAYQDERAALEPRYLEECAKQESSAQAAGDLDGVLFWRAEAEAIKRTGDPPVDAVAGDVPDRAEALRKVWRDKIDPLKGPLLPIQSYYVQKCADLADATDDAEHKQALQARGAAVKEFSHFLALCDGTAPPFPEEPAGDDAPQDLEALIAAVLPAGMQTAFKSTRTRLEQLQNDKNEAGVTSTIKQYGRKLVKDEKTLTRQGKIGAAKAVRRIKNEMLVLLGEVEGSQPGPGPAPRAEQVVVVEKGDPGDECLYERKEWKRKGRTLVCEGMDSENGIYPELSSKRAIGPGDFRVTFKMNTGRIGATSLRLALGETFLHLDDENGRLVLRQCGASAEEVTGQNLGSLVKAETPFECVLERKGSELRVLLDGVEGLKATIHDRELGRIMLWPGGARLELEDLQVQGTLIVPPSMTTLGGRNAPGAHKGAVQLMPTGNGGLTALFIAEDGNGGPNELWAKRSRDGGVKWDDLYSVIDSEGLGEPITSLGAACDERRDESYLVVATGKANQKIYFLKGRNGGRNWSRPAEITATAKQPGWNVKLSGQGLALSHYKNREGRVILPMVAGTDAARVYMLITDNGREWKVVGPLTPAVQSGVELMEDDKGTLWAATGDGGEMRLMFSSSDGGETWSEPVRSTLPDAGTRGSLAFGVGPGDQPVWYYASSHPVMDSNEHRTRTHLTLFGSRDAGKTWQELQRVHYGKWSYPTVIPLGPRRCGIGFRCRSWGWDSQEVRFVEAAGLWGK